MTFDPSHLHGVWRLDSSSATDRDGRPLPDPWGPKPMGSLVLRPDGRMMAVLCDGRADLPEDAARSYSSYCGVYRVEGEVLTTRVDAASEPHRIGSDQVRRLERRGNRLVLFPPPRADGERRELVWSRVGPTDAD